MMTLPVILLVLEQVARRGEDQRQKAAQCLLAAQNEAFWAGVISKEIDAHVEAHAECRRLLWRQGVGEHRPVIEMMLQHEEAIMRKKRWLR